MKAVPVFCVLCACAAGACATGRGVSSAVSVPLDPPEVRALWVDGFHAGIRSAVEAGKVSRVTP